MILVTERHKPRKIGERYTGVWVGDILQEDQPFVVLREATFEERPAEQVQKGLPPIPPCDPSEALFYEPSLKPSAPLLCPQPAPLRVAHERAAERLN